MPLYLRSLSSSASFYKTGCKVCNLNVKGYAYIKLYVHCLFIVFECYKDIFFTILRGMRYYYCCLYYLYQNFLSITVSVKLPIVFFLLGSHFCILIDIVNKSAILLLYRTLAIINLAILFANDP